MKNIWVVLVLVFSFVFISQVSAKDSGTMSMEEWNKFVESAVPLEQAGQKSATEEKTSELDELINSRLGKDPEVLKREGLPEDEWDRKAKTTPLVKHYKDGSVAEKKFSARIGYGNAYGLELRSGNQKRNLKANNSPVFNAGLGYSLCKYAEIQGEYSNTKRFEQGKEGQWSDAINGNVSWYYKNIHSFTSYTVNLKLGFPMTTDGVTFFPYVIGGVGRASTKYNYEEKEITNGVTTIYNEIKESAHGKCSKTGIGISVTHKNIFLFSEYNSQKTKVKMFDKNFSFYFSSVTGGIGVKF